MRQLFVSFEANLGQDGQGADGFSTHVTQDVLNRIMFIMHVHNEVDFIYIQMNRKEKNGKRN